MGRFRQEPTVGEIALTKDDAVQIGADLRGLAHVATGQLADTVGIPMGVPRLGGPNYYLKLALLVESRLIISWQQQAWLERVLAAYSEIKGRSRQV